MPIIWVYVDARVAVWRQVPMMRPEDPNSFAKCKRRGTQPQRGAAGSTLPYAPDASAPAQREAAAANLERLRASRPLKPPVKRKAPL